jgi:ABC-type transport system involved in multi-copper enzyme maturation permease subunit
MKNTMIIAANVMRDAGRRKLFYIVFLFGLAVVAFTPLLPSFTLGVQAQFLKDVSLSLTSVFGVILAVILSVWQIPVERDKRTIQNILSKPVSRLQYYAGKYLGILAVLATILAVMGVEVLLLVGFKGHSFSLSIFEGVFAVFLETAVIAAFCLCLSTFASVPINVFATVLFYMLCHVKTGFLYQKLVEGAAGFAKIITWPLYYLIPNLENFNLSLQVGYSRGVSWTYMLRLTGYAALFVALLILIGYLVFRRADL